MTKPKAKLAAGTVPAADPAKEQTQTGGETPATGTESTEGSPDDEEPTDHVQRIDKLTAEKEALKSKVADLETELDEAQGIIEDQNELLKKLQAENNEASKELTVDVDGETYEVLSAAHPHSAAELAADPELCRPFLEIEGQNVLRKKY